MATCNNAKADSGFNISKGRLIKVHVGLRLTNYGGLYGMAAISWIAALDMGLFSV